MAPSLEPGRLILVSAPRRTQGAAGRPASFWRFEGAPPPGTGKTPVLALGGLALDGRVFSRLGALARERDLVLANLPNDVPLRSRMEDMGREGLEILDAAGHAGRPAVLMGSSFGGMAVIAAAADRPDRAAALVLIGTAPSWAFVSLRLRAAAAVQGLVPRRAYPRVFAAVMLPPLRRMDPEVRADLRAQMLHRTKEFVGASIHAMRGFDAVPRLGSIRVPALVVHGSDDGVLPPRGGAALAAGLPRATLVPLAGAGHLPHVSRAAETAAAIGEFLAREGL
jgi:pimeloyl-ACP methyl ester carboxylesterase